MASEEEWLGLQFDASRINNRQMDTLIGLAKGIVSDGAVTQDEAEFLLTWLANNRFTDNVVVSTLLERIGAMLSDGFLDGEEREELLQVLTDFAGNPGSVGEALKTSSLPLDDPPPTVTIPGHRFLFTGTCAYGTRKECQEFVREQGGRPAAKGAGLNAKNVTKSLDYLVVGTYVTSSWMYESWGRKIEKAMEYRAEHGKPAIVSEETVGLILEIPEA